MSSTGYRARQAAGKRRPVGGATTYDFAFGMDVEDIQSLPNTGSPWGSLKNLADRTPFVFDPTDGTTDDCSSAFCAGLVYVRNGDTAYQTKVNDFLNSIYSQDESTWNYQIGTRKMSMIALAGQLVGRNSDPDWVDWLGDMRYQSLTGHSRVPNLHRCAWDWGSNHGMGARYSHITLDIMAGDQSSTAPDGNPSGLLNAVKWFKASIGDKSDYGCWSDTRQQYGGLGKVDAGTDAALQDQWALSASNWTPVNQSTVLFGSAVSPSKEGVLCQEALRDDAGYTTDGGGRPIFGSLGPQYHYEAGQYIVGAAIMLSANGYPDVWWWADQGVRRWREACERWNYPPPFGATRWLEHVLNKVYGTSYATTTPARSNGFVATDWLTLHADWPRRSAGPEVIDTFTRSNAGSLGTSSSGDAWTEYTNGFAISSNTAVADNENICAAFTPELTSDNHYARVTISTLPQGSSFVGPIVRAPATIGTSGTTTGEFIVATVSNASLNFYAIRTKAANSNTLTTMVSGTGAALAAGDVLQLEAEGSIVTLFRNGVQLLQWTDAGFTGQRRTGMYWDLVAGGTTFGAADDFVAGAVT